MLDFLRQHPESFLSQVFQSGINVVPPIQSTAYVVSAGTLGFDPRREPQVVDYGLLLKTATSHEGPLSELWSRVNNTQEGLVPPKGALGFHEVAIGGLVLQIPAFAVVTEDQRFEHRAQKPGRNQPCPCGSGLKFKRCCNAN